MPLKTGTSTCTDDIHYIVVNYVLYCQDRGCNDIILWKIPAHSASQISWTGTGLASSWDIFVGKGRLPFRHWSIASVITLHSFLSLFSSCLCVCLYIYIFSLTVCSCKLLFSNKDYSTWGEIAQIVRRLLCIWRTRVQIQSIPFPCCSVPWPIMNKGQVRP